MNHDRIRILMNPIEIEENPNCTASGQFVFNEISKPRLLRAIWAEYLGNETVCEVIGVGFGGVFEKAHAVKIADSGAAVAYLIYGGAWGIRLRPEQYASEAWDLANPHQWGEAFKIYGEEGDLLYK